MRRRNDPRARSDQIAASLRALIMSGDLAPGTQLASTLQLVEEHHVANTTIQRALTQLKAEGFVISQVGRGVFVRVGAYTAPTPGGFSFKILGVEENAPVPADVANGLGIATGSTAVLRHRLVLAANWVSIASSPASVAIQLVSLWLVGWCDVISGVSC